MEDILSFLQRFLSETAAQRLRKHCRGMSVALLPWNGETLIEDALADRTTSIMLWGAAGKMTIKAHFCLDTAVAWAAVGLNRHEDDVDDLVAVDFFREYSNLHAGYLRGVFEESGMLFGMSLPFVMPGEDEAVAREVRSPKVWTGAWVLSDESRHKVICSCEIELTDLTGIEKARAKLEAALKLGETDSASDGDVEFLS